jgi:hypothetical protein
LKAELSNAASISGSELRILPEERLQIEGKRFFSLVMCQDLFGGAQMRLPDDMVAVCAHI